jgi:hypothetical protein
MHALFSALSTTIACRFRSRAELELEVIALRPQLTVLRRQRHGRPWLAWADRMLWVLLYRIWPRCLDAIMIVKPATVMGWHRQGFRLFWRWRSGVGRPRADREVRALIRQMSVAQPAVGCTPDPRRAFEARFSGQSGYGRQIHGSESRRAFADLA